MMCAPKIVQMLETLNSFNIFIGHVVGGIFIIELWYCTIFRYGGEERNANNAKFSSYM